VMFLMRGLLGLLRTLGLLMLLVGRLFGPARSRSPEQAAEHGLLVRVLLMLLRGMLLNLARLLRLLGMLLRRMLLCIHSNSLLFLRRMLLVFLRGMLLDLAGLLRLLGMLLSLVSLGRLLLRLLR